MEALRCLRSDRVFPAVRRALAASSHAGFRVLQFSVQNDHVHLVVEADHGRTLSGGIRALAIRIARAVNQVLGRRGRVWGDRYHARPLSTPRAVRHALVYVLMNFKKHSRTGTEVDPCSSAAWFSGWSTRPAATQSEPPPVVDARTWLARVGWLRHGRIDPAERPKTG